MIERIKENKSLVDIRLTTGTCREFFQNNTDSFILVSSDSDYWGLISAMPEAHFLVLVEDEKCSPAVKKAMVDAGITYCYTDRIFVLATATRYASRPSLMRSSAPLTLKYSSTSKGF